MALTPLQRQICKLLAEHRKVSGESYVAGGVALNELLSGSRVSRDIDLFHDTDEAVQASWDADRKVLERAGLAVTPIRERPAFVEAEVRGGDESVRLEWVRDSAFRFFPLVEHHELGLALHPFDLATNKMLALVGRVEVRDWIDVIHCAERLQPLGYLAWAAAGKDPGFAPGTILEHAARTTRHTQEEVSALAFDGETPSAAALSRRWHALLAEARELIAVLPPDTMGTCVVDTRGNLFTGSARASSEALQRQDLTFHRGRIRGAWPNLAG